jgi:hypothetical protein
MFLNDCLQALRNSVCNITKNYNNMQKNAGIMSYTLIIRGK